MARTRGEEEKNGEEGVREEDVAPHVMDLHGERDLGGVGGEKVRVEGSPASEKRE